MPAGRERLLLTSIHDVSPRFESEIDRLIDLLRPAVGDKIAMLVVPNHWGNAPLIPGSPFAARLRAWAERGYEMFLHGYFHRDTTPQNSATDRARAKWMTAGEGEFLSLRSDEAAARIASGRDLIEDVIGRAVAGFVAPAWLYSHGAREALRQSHVPLAEDHLRVWSPATGEQLAGGPVITWASRTPARLQSSLLAAKLLRRAPLGVLRIGVHPPDVRHNRIVASIEKTLRIAGARRRPGRYADLLPA